MLQFKSLSQAFLFKFCIHRIVMNVFVFFFFLSEFIFFHKKKTVEDIFFLSSLDFNIAVISLLFIFSFFLSPFFLNLNSWDNKNKFSLSCNPKTMCVFFLSNLQQNIPELFKQADLEQNQVKKFLSAPNQIAQYKSHPLEPQHRTTYTYLLSFKNIAYR